MRNLVQVEDATAAWLQSCSNHRPDRRAKSDKQTWKKYWSGAGQTSPRLCEWDVLDGSDRSPVEVGTMLSARSIALSCSGSIVWATFVAIRATPLLLALRPALDPIGEGSIAIVLSSSNFSIMPASLAMLLAAPLLLLG